MKSYGLGQRLPPNHTYLDGLANYIYGAKPCKYHRVSLGEYFAYADMFEKLLRNNYWFGRLSYLRLVTHSIFLIVGQDQKMVTKRP